MRTFELYRRGVEGGVTEGKEAVAYNKPDQITLEGVEFSDGKVAVRWLTERGSTVVWDCFQDFYDIHIGTHPDYETEIVWTPPQMADPEKEVRQRLAGLYDPQGVEIWLNAPHRLLDSQTPLERIDQGGVKEVFAIIEQLETGAFS